MKYLTVFFDLEYPNSPEEIFSSSACAEEFSSLEKAKEDFEDNKRSWQHAYIVQVIEGN